jgi:putative flippase GtrA
MTATDRDSPATQSPRGLTALAQRRGVRQFVKFCIVGASSTAISFAVFTLVYYGGRPSPQPWLPAWLHAVLAPHPAGQQFVERYHVAVPLAETVAFALAVSSGFYWNRRWTFAHARGASVHRQYVQFVLVNLIGLTLDLAIIWGSSGLLRPLAGHFAPLLAKAVATGIVVFWNFLANKYWTFAD